MLITGGWQAAMASEKKITPVSEYSCHTRQNG
jgi:hypothetical protein